MNSDDRLLTVREAAHFLGVAVGSLYHMISERRIPVVRISRRCVRFRRTDLEGWVLRHVNQADGDYYAS